MPEKMTFEQKEFLEKIRPVLQREGAVFKKKLNVYARPAQPGETIDTATADGLETSNQAREGDFIVRNQTEAGESYIMPADKFSKRYIPLHRTDGEWLEYKPTGRIVAVELTSERLAALGLPDTFEFVAPWGSPMVAKAGDFLGSPEALSEIYRIARKEFFETYAPVEVIDED